MPLISWKNVNQVYPETVKRADATNADSSWVHYAVVELEGRLGQWFTVPFSSNNETAKDIAIDLAFARAYRFSQSEMVEGLRKQIDQRIKDLKNGVVGMVLSDGTIIQSVGGTVFSTTQDYTPVFGMSPIELSEVDSGQIYDEDVARGIYR